MKKLYSLKDKLCEELKEYSDRAKLDAASLDVIDKLTHTIKNLDKIIETYEMEEANYSMARMPRFNMSYEGNSRAYAGRGGSNAGGSYGDMSYGNSYDMSYGNSYEGSYARGRGPYAKRDSMGRYSNATGNFSADLQNLANEAPNDQVRQKIMAIMNEM